MDLETKEQFDKINNSFEGQFAKLNSRFDRLNMFIMRHVVTRAELKETIDELKEGIPSKQDFNDLMTRLDANSKELIGHRERMEIMGYKTNNLETWVKKAGPKINLEYNP